MRKLWKPQIKLTDLRGNVKTFFQKLPQRLKEGSSRQLHRLHLWSKTTGKNFPQILKKAIQEFDPQAAMNWISNTLQRRGAAFYGTLLTLLLSTYFLADLTALLVANYIPDSPTIRTDRSKNNATRAKTLENFSIIYSRNLFNSQGLIPGDESAGPQGDTGGAPVKSTLPLNLIGTLILSDERRSIATIEDKSTSLVHPMRMHDELPSKIRVIRVEPKRVIFTNLANGRREFLELPLEPGGPALSTKLASGAPTIEKTGQNQFNVSRSEVDRALADFNNILTQARAVPNFENGVAAGYKLFQIVPGSIYDKLGLVNGDVISGLNGTPINDPGKAFEMLNELKTASHLELQVKKDGKQSTYVYDIR